MGGYEGGGRPTADIPSIDPADYRPLADYVLKADGKVYQSDGVTVVFDTSGGNAWPSNDGGWKLSGDKWDWGGDQVGVLANSVFYIAGNAVVGSNPGSPGNPWQTTLIAEGYIEVSGSPLMEPNAQDLLLIAGTDVKVAGNPQIGPIANGIIAAHEQVGLSGNLGLPFSGYIVAENAAANDDKVQFNFISGLSQLTYDGTLPPLGSSASLSVLVWRQVF